MVRQTTESPSANFRDTRIFLGGTSTSSKQENLVYWTKQQVDG